MNIEVYCKKIHPKACLPIYSSENAAGADVFACISDKIIIKSMERVMIPTGLSLEIPQTCEIQVRPRSGLALKYGIALVNAPGTIDSDYRGELGILLINLGKEEVVIQHGDRIAQLVIAPVYSATFLESENLSQTKRGEGGFGSTGI
jgi:dUTP pyrophosphatase